jgi:cytochrome P450
MLTVADTKPKPPHSFLLGNVAAITRAKNSLPPKAHAQLTMLKLQREYDLPGIFYLDLYPLSNPLLIDSDPSVSSQLSQADKFVPPSALMDSIGLLIGRHSIFTSSGKEWRRLRLMFSSGFSLIHVTTLVPQLVDDMLVFQKLLAARAKTGHVFRMNDMTTYLALDMIGKIMTGESYRSQTEQNAIASMFLTALTWTWSATNSL